MKNNLSKRILSMEHSPVEKYYKYANETEKNGTKLYHLNIGQPDIKTSPVFMDAVKNFDSEVLAYTPSGGMTEILDAAINYYRRYDVELARDNMIVTNGGSEALIIAMAAILDEGDEVIIPEPFYTNYNMFVGWAGGLIAPIRTKAEDGYHYADRELIEAAVTERTKAICLCNPGNPTGVVLTEAEMKIVCEMAVKHDLFIVVDEVYREFTYDGMEALSFGRFDDITDRLIIIDSVSKKFSACGARIGLLITKNNILYDNLMKIAQARLCCPTLDQIGAAELYKLPGNFFDEVKAEYQHRRDIAFKELSKIDGIVCHKPNGAFYITCKLPVKNVEDFLMFMLTEYSDNGESVMFTPAEGFYATSGQGTQEIRIAYVLKEKDLIRGIEIMKKGIEEYKNRQ